MFKEWPLVAFTVLGQTAVGILLAFGVPWVLVGVAISGPRTERLWVSLLALSLGLLATAAAVSFFHLHHPLRAARALANLRSSWLSREILFEIMTGLFLGLAIVLTLTGVGALWFLKAVMAGACLSGLLFLISMIRLYKLPTVPAWDQIWTPISFLATTLIIGLMVLAFLWRHFSEQTHLTYEMLGLAFWAVILEIGAILLFDPRLGKDRRRLGASLRPPEVLARRFSHIRIALLVAGLVFLGAILMRPIPYAEPLVIIDPPPYDLGPLGLHVGALVALAAAEVIGRFHFYGLVRRPGD